MRCIKKGFPSIPKTHWVMKYIQQHTLQVVPQCEYMSNINFSFMTTLRGGMELGMCIYGDIYTCIC